MKKRNRGAASAIAWHRKIAHRVYVILSQNPKMLTAEARKLARQQCGPPPGTHRKKAKAPADPPPFSAEREARRLLNGKRAGTGVAFDEWTKSLEQPIAATEGG